MKKLPISVFIITKNEEDRIEKAINSVTDFADEILIIDSGSTDKTIQICKNLGVNVIFNEWRGYGQQKIFGENQCKNDWILNIDADERVSKELIDEITKIFTKDIPNKYIGYKIKILNQFFNEDQPKKLAYYYNQLRLYNKNFAGFKNSTIHDSVALKDQSDSNLISKLYNNISHQSFRSYAHWIEKIDNYSNMQAIEAFAKGKKYQDLKF